MFKKITKPLVCWGVTLSLMSSMVPVVPASANSLTREQRIEEAVRLSKDHLTYDSIRSQCVDSWGSAFTNVTDQEIKDALYRVADSQQSIKTQINNNSFLMTFGMLDDHYNSVFWPATHNSFANDVDGESGVTNYLSIEDTNSMATNYFKTPFGNLSSNIVGSSPGTTLSTENHVLSMRETLNRGIRCLDIDLGPAMDAEDMLLSGIEAFLENGVQFVGQGIAYGFDYVGNKIIDDVGNEIVNEGNKVLDEVEKVIEDTGKVLEDVGKSIKNGFNKVFGRSVRGVAEMSASGGAQISTRRVSKPSWSWDDVLDNIDVDWNDIQAYHRVGFMGTTPLDKLTGAVNGFLADNPNEIVSIRVSDLYDGLFGNLYSDEGDIDKFYYILNEFLDKLDQDGVLDRVANYYGDDSVPKDQRHEYLLMPGETYHGNEMTDWPLLGDMLLSEKNVILIFPKYNKIKGDNSTLSKNTDNGSFSKDAIEDDQPYQKSSERISLSDEQAKDLAGVPHRLLKADTFQDGNTSAGDKISAGHNNNGRRIYQMVHDYNEKLASKNVGRIVNFVGVDYFVGNKSKGGTQEVDIIDAANRINWENNGHSWDLLKNTPFYWNYYDRSSDTSDLNRYVSKISGYFSYAFNPKTDIPAKSLTAGELSDGNVWTGSEASNFNFTNGASIDFDRGVIVDRVSINLFAYNDVVPIEILKVNGLDIYSLGFYNVHTYTDQDWYHIDLDYEGEVKELLIKIGNENIHLKEIAVKSREYDRLVLHHTYYAAEEDTFVDSNNPDYNYPHVIYKRISSSESVLMRFDTSAPSLVERRTQLNKAYLNFFVDLNGPYSEFEGDMFTVNVREDRNAPEWDRFILTANIANGFNDTSNSSVKKIIARDSYVKVDVTDIVNNHLNGNAGDNISFRIWNDENQSFTIHGDAGRQPPFIEYIFTEGAQVFRHTSYGGESAHLGVGSYNLDDLERLGMANDSISSIKVPSGFTVECYEHNGLRGRKVTFTANSTHMPEGFNDKISSIKVIRN